MPPQPGSLLRVRGTVPTRLGSVYIDYSVADPHRKTLEVHIPVGMVATVRLPGQLTEAGLFLLNGEKEKVFVERDFTSGVHRFELIQ